MSEWKEEFYVKVYQLARDGRKESDIADTLGVSLKVFREWRKEKPALAEAYRTGRSIGERELVPKKLDGLSEMQRQFVHEYLVDLNGARAAERAGYSKKTAAVQANANLKKPLVQKAILQVMQERTHRTDIKADRVLRELACIAFSNPKNLFDEEGVLKEIVDMDEPVQRSIQAMDVSPDGRVRLKFWDKVNALHLLMKHLAMIAPNKQMNGVHTHQHLHLEQKDNPYLKLSGEDLIEVKKVLEKLDTK